MENGEKKQEQEQDQDDGVDSYMVSKDDLNRIRDQLNEIQKSCSATEQHLSEINSKISRHEKCINSLDNDIEDNQQYINRVEGGLRLLAFLFVILAGVIALLQYLQI